MNTTTVFNTEQLAAKAIAALPKTLDLIYIDYRDELTDQQCAQIVAGQKDQCQDDINENLFTAEYDGIRDALEEALPDDDERDALRDSKHYDDFTQACYERNVSDPYADLLRNTSKQLVRFYLRTRQGERIALEADSWRWDAAKTEREAKRLCRAAKQDWAANRDNFIELVQNATYGGVLCVIAYVDMRGIDKIVEHCLHGDERGRVKLTFQDPHLLAHDSWNGSGHDVRVKGNIVLRFGRGAIADHCGVMELDAKGTGHGYSWDETCGLHKPAYDTGMNITLYRAKKNQHLDKPSSTSWPGR